MNAQPHIPVMLAEVLEYLQPKPHETYVDCTLGAGGYTRAILDSCVCNVIAIDRDDTAHAMAKTWAEKYGNHLTLVHGSFADLKSHLKNLGKETVDAIVLDLGVSSMQLDQAERGFSFRFDGPLDMRMDRSQGQTAADLVNTQDEESLANIIYKYGEERQSRRIARAIVNDRVKEPFKTTKQLADLVGRIVHFSPKDKSHPATRTFQALRIAVNAEMEALEDVLQASENCLVPGGRLVVVTFHSLEDHIVKSFLNSRAKPPAQPSRFLPQTSPSENFEPSFTLMLKKPLEASSEETKVNPRSRSAKLRAALRTSSPAHDIRREVA